METDGNGWSFGPEVIFHRVPVLLDPLKRCALKRCPEATTGRGASSTFLVNDHLLQDGSVRFCVDYPGHKLRNGSRWSRNNIINRYNILELDSWILQCDLNWNIFTLTWNGPLNPSISWKMSEVTSCHRMVPPWPDPIPLSTGPSPAPHRSKILEMWPGSGLVVCWPLGDLGVGQWV